MNYLHSVTIGYVPFNEDGKSTGGINKEKDLYIGLWFNKSWKKVLRPVDQKIAFELAQTVEDLYNQVGLIYNKEQRNNFFKEAKIVNWNISKLKDKYYVDCSAFIAVCANIIGIHTPIVENVASIEKSLLHTGAFLSYNSPQLLNSSDYLQRGDILISNNHTAIVLNNGLKIQKTVKNKNNIGIATALKNVNLRTGPDIKYLKIGILTAGTQVRVLENTENNWYKIEWSQSNAGYAYVSNSDSKCFKFNNDITFKKAKIVNYNIRVEADPVEIRKVPAANSSIIGKLKNHTVYTIVQQNGDYGFLKSGLGWIYLPDIEKI